MDKMLDVIKRVAQKESRAILTTELGEITAVFPHKAEDDNENYQCSVKLKNKLLLDGQNLELRKVPVAVPYVGFAAIPRIGDLVLVSFVGGDINAPVITGRLYHDGQRPPLNQEEEFLLQHTNEAKPSFLIDREGKLTVTTKEEKKVITLEDETLLIKHADGGSIKLDTDGKTSITSQDEKNVVTIENDKISLVNEKYSLVIDISGQKIKIVSDKDIEVSAANGKILLDAKEVTIKSAQAVAIEAGTNLNLKGGSAVKVEGAQIDVG